MIKFCMKDFLGDKFKVVEASNGEEAIAQF